MLHKFFVLCFSLGLLAGQANAEVRLDQNFPWTEEQVGVRLEGANYFAAAIDRDQVAQGFPSERFYATLHFFRMRWNENTFYIAGVHYKSKEEWASIKKDVANKTESKPLAGGGICAFFVYNANLKQLAKYDIKLKEANGNTWCNGVRGLARVKGQDAVLYSLSYYLTGMPLAQRPEDIGKGWRYMTVLLKLREQDGKVFIEQDDSCLKNPNQHNDLASARKALAICAKQQSVGSRP